MSKKDVKLYPPQGGGYVIPHPTQVERMKANGWVEKPLTKTMSKEKSNGKS
tara:strand:- start:1033 stop:1185 length:153 start_codon:yes stop_codon:yes gene_type:complete